MKTVYVVTDLSAKRSWVYSARGSAALHVGVSTVTLYRAFKRGDIYERRGWVVMKTGVIPMNRGFDHKAMRKGQEALRGFREKMREQREYETNN